jgi:protein O-mannosyl-transferase
LAVRLKIFICLLLAGITLAVYWPAKNYEAVFYDDTFFTDNPEVQSGLNGHSLAWAMTGVVAANWHPVTSLSFVLTHQCFGTNPGAEHLVNVAIHAANAVLLFLVLLGMTTPARVFSLSSPKGGEGRGEEEQLSKGPNQIPSPQPSPRLGGARESGTARGDARPTTENIWRCAAVAAVFAWHPLRVESVAWIAERKDVLCGFFMLLTFWAWTRYVQKTEDRGQRTEGRGQRTEDRGQKAEVGNPTSDLRPLTSGYFWLAIFCFALGLMSKAMVVTLPFLLLLLDVWPLRRIYDLRFTIYDCKKLLLEKIPFFALTAVFCAVTFLVQHNSDATPSLQQLGFGLRLENIIVSYVRYLIWTAWPANLAVYYSFPYDSHFYLALWPAWEIVAAALLLAGVSVLCLKQIVRRPYLAVGWFWYLGTMVPVIGLVQVGGQGMADRYTYIPLIGPVIALVWLVSEKWRSGIFAKTLLAILTAAALSASIVQTRHQLQFWRNTETLSRHTIEVTGENTRAEYILALGLEHKGDIPAAMIHYRNAMTSQPAVKEAFYAMGRLFGQQGKWTLAELAYSKMLENNPDDFTAHLGLATVLPHLGRDAEAETHLKAALQACPDTPDALNNLAWTLATSGTANLRDGARAVELAERACKLTDYRETIMVGTLGAAYAEAGRFDDAMATAQKACALATESGKTELLNINQNLLELYRQHQPYREIANPDPADTLPR